MDSKFVGAGLVIVSLCAITTLLVVLAVNGVFNKKNTADTGTQQVAEEASLEASEDGMIPYSDLTAWMSDETFFDEEKFADGRYEVVEKKIVSYKVTTVDKDLRILFLDDEGELISGRKFKINIEGLGDYTDTDRDGIVYVENVDPGDYSLSMAEIYGYEVPENPSKVSVKAGIEYKAIADISYLIKTEADIDPALEDTFVKEVAEEDPGETGIRTVEGASFGIDVSKWNNEIDWKKVKEAGVQFAIIRCGYRGSRSGAIVEDPYFRANVEGATQAGIPIGIYFFTQATTEKEGIEEASAVMSLIKDYELTYPVYIDTESAGGTGRADKLDVADRTKAVEAFCETIRSGKYTAGIYASKNWFNTKLDVTKLSDNDAIWLAQYAQNPTYEGKYQIWQYSSAGRVQGIEGRVDMNLSYLDVSKETDSKEGKVDKEAGEEPDKEDDKAIKEESENDAKKESDKEKDNKERDEDGQADSRNM